MSCHVERGEFRGEPSIRLVAGPTSVRFLPGLGMLGVQLRHAGRSYLSLHGGPAAFAAGHTTGVPLLAPWANRLAGDQYRVGRTNVDLSDVPVGRDGNGLPMHGLMLGERRWDVDWTEAWFLGDSGSASLSAHFPFSGDERLLAGFPFPHDIGVRVEVQPGVVEFTTSITPTGRRSVPVSFGWHPYFRLPDVRRRGDLVVGLPQRHRLDLDEMMIPTGSETTESAEERALGTRTFDDAYRLGSDKRFRLSVSASSAVRASSLEVEMGEGYSHAQVYAPKGRSFIAFEPMTAPANALVTGAHPTVAVGDTFQAIFRVRLT